VSRLVFFCTPERAPGAGPRRARVQSLFGNGATASLAACSQRQTSFSSRAALPSLPQLSLSLPHLFPPSPSFFPLPPAPRLQNPPQNPLRRWYNSLDPALNREPFSALEERTILEQHARFGNAWSAIARALPGRTDNAVKNCFNGRLRARAAAAARHARLEGRPYGREVPERKGAAPAGGKRPRSENSEGPSAAADAYPCAAAADAAAAGAVSPPALLERCPERLSPSEDGDGDCCRGSLEESRDEGSLSDSEASAASALESLSRGGSFLFLSGGGDGGGGSGTSSPSSSIGGGAAFAPTPPRRRAISQAAARRRLLQQRQQQQPAGGVPSVAAPSSPTSAPRASQMRVQVQQQQTQRLFAAAAGPPPAAWASEASLRAAWEAAMRTAAAAVAAASAAGAGAGGSGSSPGSPLAASASAAASASSSHLEPGSSSSPSSPSAAANAAAFAPEAAALAPAGPSRFAPPARLRQQQLRQQQQQLRQQQQQLRQQQQQQHPRAAAPGGPSEALGSLLASLRCGGGAGGESGSSGSGAASPAAPPLFSSPLRGAAGPTAAAATTGDGGKAETVDAAAARLAPYLAAALAAAGCWPSAA